MPQQGVSGLLTAIRTELLMGWTIFMSREGEGEGGGGREGGGEEKGGGGGEGRGGEGEGRPLVHTMV